MRLKIASNVRFLRLCTKSCIKRCKLDVNQSKKAIRLYEPDGLKCLYLLRSQTLIISQADASSGARVCHRQFALPINRSPYTFNHNWPGLPKQHVYLFNSMARCVKNVVRLVKHLLYGVLHNLVIVFTNKRKQKDYIVKETSMPRFSELLNKKRWVSVPNDTSIFL